MDMVNSPQHYQMDGLEVIDIIETLIKYNCTDPFEGYLYGNIIKYLSRYKRKNQKEDLEKAKWYLEKLIDTE